MSTVYIVGIIILAVMFSGGVGAWVYVEIHGTEKPAISAPVSPELLEAMREVDAMLPGTTPIAPKEPPRTPWSEVGCARCRRAPHLDHAKYDPFFEVFYLEDGTEIDLREYHAWPRGAKNRALLAHLRSIGVPI